MATEQAERLLKKSNKDIVTASTFAIKDIGGNYKRRPIEEIYRFNEIYVAAHMRNILGGDFQPLVDFADMITRKRTADRFRLHELLRAALSYKKVVYPILIRELWENKDDLVHAMVAVDRSVDRFVVNLGQVFVHYAKGYLVQDPLEFPVWLDHLWKRTVSPDKISNQ